MATLSMDSFEDELPPSYELSAAPIAPLFRAEDFQDDGKKHIILASSGSLATLGFNNIVIGAKPVTDVSIRIVLTTAAVDVFDAADFSLQTLRCFPHVEGIYTDSDQWSIPQGKDQIVIEHELGKWADILMIAPLDANTLAKITYGIADNLLTSLVRGWDPHGSRNPLKRANRPKFLSVAPAFNRPLWEHPVTKMQLDLLETQWRIDRPVHLDTLSKSKKGTNKPCNEPWAKVIRPKDFEKHTVSPVANGLVISWQDVVNVLASQVWVFDKLGG